MEKDEKVVVLVISSVEKKVHLFRIHIYEDSIRFDERFNTGIQNNPSLREEVNEINTLWKNHVIHSTQIFPMMIDVMSKYGEYLQDYYFDKSELDADGRYVESFEPSTCKNITYHYEFLRDTNQLKKISKKEFEKHVTANVADAYVDNYVKRGAKFYMSEYFGEYENSSQWYFMVVKGELKISFCIASI